MNAAIDKLVKFLRLEADRGFDNRSVLGGLDRMLDPWQSEARETGVQETTIQVVVSRLRDYPQLTPGSRQEALRGVWARLRTEFPDQLPPVLVNQPAFEPSANIGGSPSVAPEEIPALPAATPSGGSSSERPLPSAPPSEPERKPEADMARFPGEPDEQTTDEGEDTDHPLPMRSTSPQLQGPAALDAPLTAISGIGPKSALTLEKLGLRTLSDLLWYLPRRYDDYSQLKTINRLWYGEEVTVIGTVEEIHVRPVRGGSLKLVDAVISDGSGALRVTWFNQPWIAQQLTPGRAVVLSGKIDQYLGRLTMNSPEWEPLERQQLHTNRIVPVYGLTAGVTPKWLRRVINAVVMRYAPRVVDPLPESVRASAGLTSLGSALQQVHFPDSWEALHRAQARLAFQEMFLLQLGVLRQKRDWTALPGDPIQVEDDWLDGFIRRLPYELTPPQKTAVSDVRQDLAAPRPMNRLLQGDVGSGKTLVAATAIAIVAHYGAQSAMMAPTSLLADQHRQTLLSLLTDSAGLPADSIRLLVGSTPESEKQEIRVGLADGTIKVVVGTHALLEDPVVFSRLELAVIDEQHRFGVDQRAVLRAKGANPNLLVMTATPIPRSLALTLYGDLDLSILDELPPGRQPIETRVLQPVERTRGHRFVQSQLDAGRQAFLIYPLVEESEKIEAKAAVDEYERLRDEVFPGYRLGLLHGRMRPEEKDAAMAQFRAGELDILVSTSVVEVGVDVPNATVMVIEGANRFGLSQLHQFRGRVGRGEHKSYCLLLPDTDEAASNERLRAMEGTNDGFKLAEMDLEQRGPGDFLGTRQSGFVELRMAQLTDVRLIEQARREAARLFDSDPDLTSADHQALSAAVDRFWSGGKGEIS
jgi:ATP-dependent DNA helicase RecG